MKSIVLILLLLCLFTQPVYAQVYIVPYPDTEYIYGEGECKGLTRTECTNNKMDTKRASMQRALDNDPKFCETYYGTYYPIRKHCDGVGISCTPLYGGYHDRISGGVLCRYEDSWLGKARVRVAQTKEWHKQLNAKIRTRP